MGWASCHVQGSGIGQMRRKRPCREEESRSNRGSRSSSSEAQTPALPLQPFLGFSEQLKSPIHFNKSELNMTCHVALWIWWMVRSNACLLLYVQPMQIWYFLNFPFPGVKHLEVSWKTKEIWLLNLLRYYHLYPYNEIAILSP